MPEYRVIGTAADGRRRELTWTTDVPTLALDEARRRELRVLMIERDDRRSGGRRRRLLAASNAPPPRYLPASRLQLHGPEGSDRVRDACVREAIRAGRVAGDAGWFRTRVETESLLRAAMTALPDTLFVAPLQCGLKHLHPAPPGDGEPRREDDRPPSVPPDSEHRPDAEDPLGVLEDLMAATSGEDRALEELETRTECLVSCAASVGLRDPAAPPDSPVGDPAVVRLAALQVVYAVEQGGRGLRLRKPDPNSAWVEYEAAVGGWRPMVPYPPHLHEELILLFAAGVGIRPDELPVRRSQIECRVDDQRFVILGETDLTDGGECIEIRWEAGPESPIPRTGSASFV